MICWRYFPIFNRTWHKHIYYSLKQWPQKIKDRTFQWKMTFNPDRSKEAQEIIFSRKLKKATHPPLLFNNNNVSQVNFQTHLGVILDVKLTFEEHLKNVFNKTNKMIGLLKKLSYLLPRQALVTIYKAFIRPHLDYGRISSLSFSLWKNVLLIPCI